ncbi:hypothetical protein [Lactobacillus melliventris]|uniref:hypothetical protein n=1 Tax=Lactobacillus melliventris TaxID=1218507 RepID=UPI001650CFD4|nr:hypothetical protein [Lactobacillus melliventris]MBC6348778.1 hypothetical protein [Lactobacillus melliventris]
MKSLTLYKVNKLDIDDSVSLIKDKKPVGTISPSENTLTISKNTFKEYSCTYNFIVKEDILVSVNDDFIPVSEYQHTNSFKAFYCKEKNLFFVFAPSSICRGFIKSLKSTYSEEVDISNPIKFPFDKIKTYEKSARGLYFNVDDDTVTSKHFFGTGVEQNDEAVEAIDKNRATYLMAKIDVSGISRTIGFSKKGALVMYSKPMDKLDKDYPYLELAVEILQAIQLWK